MATDIDIAKNALAGQLGSAVTDAPGTAARGFRRSYSVLVNDAATAGTAITITPVVAGVPYACRIVSATLSAPIAVAVSESVYVTFSLAKYTSAGGSATAVGTRVTNAAGGGAMVAFARDAMTLTATATEVAQYGVITIAAAKASTGTALTAATSWLCVTVVTEDI